MTINIMEGPFFIEAHIEGDLLFLKSEDGKISWTIDKLEFAKELIRAANETSRSFYNVGLVHLSENLNIAVKRLRDVLNGQGCT